MPSFFHRTSLRPLYFILGSCGLTLAPFLLARALWPEGLNANAANFFWPASGWNLAFVLLWGRRYAPLILLNALAAVLLIGQPMLPSIMGASLNLLEALLGSSLLIRFANGLRPPFTPRSVVALCATSLLIGLTVALPYTGLLVGMGVVPAALYGTTAVGNTAANACAVLLITPAVCALSARTPVRLRVPPASLLASALLAAVCLFAFQGVFQGRFNYAFALFPVLTFYTLRFPFSRICGFLVLVMGMIYLSLILNAARLPVVGAPEILWFIQAFSWVLAATTLGMSALISENQRHELQALLHENDLLESRLRARAAELETLRYQINPHFLYNALNSIYATVEEDAGLARQMITRLSAFFRSTLESPAGERIPLETAVRNVLLYVDIEKCRHGEALQVSVEVDPDLRAQPIPVFLLQPLVENAIQHGFMQCQGDFELHIRARSEAGACFVVEIDHPGRWRDSPDPVRSGVGLENIRQRLQLLYADRARLETVLEAERVCQRLHLPLEKS